MGNPKDRNNGQSAAELRKEKVQRLERKLVASSEAKYLAPHRGGDIV